MAILRSILQALMLFLAFFHAQAAIAQDAYLNDEKMPVSLHAQAAPVAGEDWYVAFHFKPIADEWHGYWANPGDAGVGLDLDWNLPEGWIAGEPLYPLPQQLVIGGLMNHVFKGDYAVIVPISVPDGAPISMRAPIGVTLQYLACTDAICVPQGARIDTALSGISSHPEFDRWRAAVVPMLDTAGSWEMTNGRLRVAIPVPQAVALNQPHLYLENRELGDGWLPAYAAEQTYAREGDLAVVEIPLNQLNLPAGFEAAPQPAQIDGILAFDGQAGVRFSATHGAVPVIAGNDTAAALWLLLIGALAGGLLLNVMPCVFPILSLKALALVKAGGDEGVARRDALAYTAGTIAACLAIGGALLALRAAGSQIGWAFQLQEPGVVVALLVLAVAITANLVGLFDLPGPSISGGRGTRGSFLTGLLAAFVATPCTGPFMAAALGAALLLPTGYALALFAALGLGLGLPFLLLGFVPQLRRMLPKPGAWMEGFRRWMAVPMGLTALALVWLLWTMGGPVFALSAVIIAAAAVALLRALLPSPGQQKQVGTALVALAIGGAAAYPLITGFDRPSNSAQSSILEPKEFSEETLAKARATGRPVFVWFTANWCVTCKVNESVAIEREATREAFEAAGVIALRADWTLRDEEIARFLTDRGVAGIPLYLWYPADGDAQQLPQVLTPDSLVDLARSVAPAPAP